MIKNICTICNFVKVIRYVELIVVRSRGRVMIVSTLRIRIPSVRHFLSVHFRITVYCSSTGGGKWADKQVCFLPVSLLLCCPTPA